MKEQIHKRLSDEQVRAILEKYCCGEIKTAWALDHLGIKRRQFFEWVKRYEQEPKNFSIAYKRKSINRKIDKGTEDKILEGLMTEKKLIKDKRTPIQFYNYSFLQKTLTQKGIDVSVPTIINRAKKHGFYIPRKEKKAHDREVITNYVGELVQHDSSHHLFAPSAQNKWYLITSIDDCSRFILYGNLFETESSWKHIEALEYVCLNTGVPFRYYTDSHSIFRFIQPRDSFYRKHIAQDDETDPQWRRVLRDLKVDVTHALSPQAKGKIERPYRWMQDHLVRICARENIRLLSEAREALKKELNHYNYQQVHSTTKEIPYRRLQQHLKQKKSLFRPFKIPQPYLSTKDIFCLRIERTTDSYRKISLLGLELRLPINPHEKVELRMSPSSKEGMTDLRIWHKMKLADVKLVKTSDLKGINF